MLRQELTLVRLLNKPPMLIGVLIYPMWFMILVGQGTATVLDIINKEQDELLHNHNTRANVQLREELYT